MKIVRTANNKKRITFSKSDWISIGKTAGWIVEAKNNRNIWASYFNDNYIGNI